MRERPKQPSYLERHRSIEEHVPRGSTNVGIKLKQPNDPTTKSTVASIIPKKVDRSGDVAALRVRSGGAPKVIDKSSVGSNSGPGGGKMTQYKSLDDIPDGLPDSPQSKVVDLRRNNGNRYNDEEDDADDDYELSRSPFDAPTRSTTVRTPSYSELPVFPSEKAYRTGNHEVDRGSYQVDVRGAKLSKYPPLQTDQDTKQRPIVYQKSHMKSPSKPQECHANDDENWNDDDSEGESLPSYQSKNGKMSYYDGKDVDSSSRSERPSATSAKNDVVLSRKISSNDSKHSNSIPHSLSQSSVHSQKGACVGLGNKIEQPPPGLPYEIKEEKRERDRNAGSDGAGKEIISEKDRLYFSKQPRPVEYTPYTLGQYRQSNPKEYVEIVPHIKPDLNSDILKAKRANADRIKDFSKQLNEFNKISLSDQKRIPYSCEASGVEISRRKLESNRERAMQFAKHIPKPLIKLKGDGSGKGEEDGTGTGERTTDDVYLQADEYGQSYEKASKLQELQAKHEDSRRNVQAIRKSMGM